MNNLEENIVEKFGLEKINYDLLSRIDSSDILIKRKLLTYVRGSKELEEAINTKNFYVLTGVMPSFEKIHFGTFGVIKAVKFFQKSAKFSIVLVADVEAYLTRNIPYEKTKEIAYNIHIPTYLSLGLSEKTIFYFQSENKSLIKIATDVAKNITLNNFREVYGDISPERIYSSTFQIADILFPQLIRKIYPIIPVGIDQDPHLRLCRDYVRKTNSFDFLLPIGIYIKTIPSLSGEEKMSKSKPEDAIFLPEEENVLRKKIFSAFSGGGITIEEHRKKGANLDIDVCYRILEFVDESDKFYEMSEKYRKGEILSGEFKEYTFYVLQNFMREFREKLEYYRDFVKKGNIIEIHSIEELKEFIE
ncbi:MAG: tryptophan--tRNA ligase [Candidatus Aenigmatarchaeota archaeon]